MIAFTACNTSNSNNNETYTKPSKTVTITESNLNSYFKVKTYVTSYNATESRSPYFKNYSCTLTIEIEKLDTVALVEEIPVVFKLVGGSLWNFPEKEFDCGYPIIELNIPRSGYLYKSINCTYYGTIAPDLPAAEIYSVLDRTVNLK